MRQAMASWANVASWMPSPAAGALSSMPDVSPPGVFKAVQTSHPPFLSNQVAMPVGAIIEPQRYSASIQGQFALPSRGYGLLPADEKPPGVEEMPPVATISPAKSSSTHLPILPLVPQPWTGNSMPAFPLAPPSGMAPSYGFRSQFLQPPPHPPHPPPPLPPLPPQLPQRHIIPPQVPRFGLSEGNVHADITKKHTIPKKDNLTIFVGKIVPSLSEEFLTSVLKLCGSIRSWTRGVDPITGSPKGFGFCDYESPEDLLRALRLLNRLKLEGQELVLKVDQKTLNYLEHYIDEKIKGLKSQTGSEIESAPGLEAENEANQVTFDVPREVPVEERLGWVCDKENEIDKEVCEKLVKLLESRDQMRLLQLPPCVANTKADLVETCEEYERGSPTEESLQRVKLTEWKQFDFSLERYKLKVQALDGTSRSSESCYLEYEKLWEECERAKENHRTREMERLEFQQKMRQKLLTEQEESIISHKRIYSDEKYKRRRIEREKDDNDQKLERRNIGFTGASTLVKEEDTHLPTGELSQNRFLDLSTRAKIAFCFKNSSKQRPSANAAVGGGNELWGGDELSVKNCRQQELNVSSVYYRNPTFTLERESSPKDHHPSSMGKSIPKERKLDVDESSNMDSEKQPVTQRAVNAKELIDSLPKTKDEIFAFCMDWAKVDEHCVHERVRPWVSKKISEFLGEEEVTLVDFIIGSAKKHMTPFHLQELLENIFVDEAELFVVKLWRALIFETKKVECGLAGG